MSCKDPLWLIRALTGLKMKFAYNKGSRQLEKIPTD